MSVPGVAHAFSTRRAEKDDPFDLGRADSHDEGVTRRRHSFLEAAGFGGRDPLILRQVHGSRVVRARDAEPLLEADGSIWLAGDSADPVPAVRTADCVPILLVDRTGRGAAAVHAGWRGTAERVAAEAVAVLARLGVPPGDLVAALGPAIRRCCYRVGEEVAARVGGSVRKGARHRSVSVGENETFWLDLHAANRAQLEELGVPSHAIHEAPWCTRCRDDLFFSHRREGPQAGRMMSCVGAARGAPA